MKKLDFCIKSSLNFLNSSFVKLLPVIAMLLSASANSMVLNGMGEYRDFGAVSMMIKLELSAPALDTESVFAQQGKKRLSIKIVEPHMPRKWTRFWVQSLSINSSAELIGDQSEDLIAMTQVVRQELLPGDLVVFERVASNKTKMLISDVPVAEFNTRNFFEFLTLAFIGPVPPSSRLKGQLLASSDVTPAIMASYDNITAHSVERSEQIAAIYAPKPAKTEQASIASQDNTTEEIAELELTTELDKNQDQKTTDPGILIANEGNGVSKPQADEPVVLNLDAEATLLETERGDEEFLIAFNQETIVQLQNYQEYVRQAVNTNVRYPRVALKRGLEGYLRVALYINEDGSLEEVQVVESSGFKPFDRAVAKAAENVEGFEPLPTLAFGAPLLVELPFSFMLDRT